MRLEFQDEAKPKLIIPGEGRSREQTISLTSAGGLLKGALETPTGPLDVTIVPAKEDPVREIELAARNGDEPGMKVAAGDCIHAVSARAPQTTLAKLSTLKDHANWKRGCRLPLDGGVVSRFELHGTRGGMTIVPLDSHVWTSEKTVVRMQLPFPNVKTAIIPVFANFGTPGQRPLGSEYWSYDPSLKLMTGAFNLHETGADRPSVPSTAVAFCFLDFNQGRDG